MQAQALGPINGIQTFLVESNRSGSEIDANAPESNHGRWTSKTNFELERGDRISVECAAIESTGASSSTSIEFSGENITRGQEELNFTDDQCILEFNFYIQNNGHNSVNMPIQYRNRMGTTAAGDVSGRGTEDLFTQVNNGLYGGSNPLNNSYTGQPTAPLIPNTNTQNSPADFQYPSCSFTCQAGYNFNQVVGGVPVISAYDIHELAMDGVQIPMPAAVGTPFNQVIISLPTDPGIVNLTAKYETQAIPIQVGYDMTGQNLPFGQGSMICLQDDNPVPAASFNRYTEIISVDSDIDATGSASNRARINILDTVVGAFETISRHNQCIGVTFNSEQNADGSYKKRYGGYSAKPLATNQPLTNPTPDPYDQNNGYRKGARMAIGMYNHSSQPYIEAAGTIPFDLVKETGYTRGGAFLWEQTRNYGMPPAYIQPQQGINDAGGILPVGENPGGLRPTTSDLRNFKDNNNYILTRPDYCGPQPHPNGLGLCPELEPMSCFVHVKADSAFEDVNSLANLFTEAFHAINKLLTTQGDSLQKYIENATYPFNKKNQVFPLFAEGWFEPDQLAAGAVNGTGYPGGSYRPNPGTYKKSALWSRVAPMWLGNCVKCIPANMDTGTDWKYQPGSPYYYWANELKDYLKTGLKNDWVWDNQIYGNMGLRDFAKCKAGDRLCRLEVWDGSSIDTWPAGISHIYRDISRPVVLNTQLLKYPVTSSGGGGFSDIPFSCETTQIEIGQAIFTNIQWENTGWESMPGADPTTLTGYTVNATREEIAAIRLRRYKNLDDIEFAMRHNEKYMVQDNPYAKNGQQNQQIQPWWIYGMDLGMSRGDQKMLPQNIVVSPEPADIETVTPAVPGYNTPQPDLATTIPEVPGYYTPQPDLLTPQPDLVTPQPDLVTPQPDLETVIPEVPATATLHNQDTEGLFTQLETTDVVQTNGQPDRFYVLPDEAGENYINFRDDGGLSGNYTNNNNRSVIFDAGDNNWIYIRINNIQIEASASQLYDRLGITASDAFSGLAVSNGNLNTTTAPVLAPLMKTSANAAPYPNCWSQSFVNNNAAGGYIFPLNSSTFGTGWYQIKARYARFWFHSDGSVMQSGWDIDIAHEVRTDLIPGYTQYTPQPDLVTPQPDLVTPQPDLVTPQPDIYTPPVPEYIEYTGQPDIYTPAVPAFSTFLPGTFINRKGFPFFPVQTNWMQSWPESAEYNNPIHGVTTMVADEWNQDPAAPQTVVGDIPQGWSWITPTQSVIGCGGEINYQQAKPMGNLNVFSRWNPSWERGKTEQILTPEPPFPTYAPSNEYEIKSRPDGAAFPPWAHSAIYHEGGNQDWIYDYSEAKKRNIGCFPYQYTSGDGTKHMLIGWTCAKNYTARNNNRGSWEMLNLNWGDLFGFSPQFGYDQPTIVPINNDLIANPMTLNLRGDPIPPENTTPTVTLPDTTYKQNCINQVWVGASNASMIYSTEKNRYELGGLYSVNQLSTVNLAGVDSGTAASGESGEKIATLNGIQNDTAATTSTGVTPILPINEDVVADPAVPGSNTLTAPVPGVWDYDKRNQGVEDGICGIALANVYHVPKNWSVPEQLNPQNLTSPYMNNEEGSGEKDPYGADITDVTNFKNQTAENYAIFKKDLTLANSSNWAGTILNKMGFEYDQIIPYQGSQSNRYSDWTYGSSDIAIQDEGVKPLMLNAELDVAATQDLNTYVWRRAAADAATPPVYPPPKLLYANAEQPAYGTKPSQGTPLYRTGQLNNSIINLSAITGATLTAKNTPSLYSCPYYIILTDIIPTEFQKGSMSQNSIYYGLKSYSAGQYFYIYGSQYSQLVQNPRLVQSITTELRNPLTGALARVGKNSSIIYKIERDITLPAITMEADGTAVDPPTAEADATAGDSAMSAQLAKIFGEEKLQEASLVKLLSHEKKNGETGVLDRVRDNAVRLNVRERERTGVHQHDPVPEYRDGDETKGGEGSSREDIKRHIVRLLIKRGLRNVAPDVNDPNIIKKAIKDIITKYNSKVEGLVSDTESGRLSNDEIVDAINGLDFSIGAAGQVVSMTTPQGAHMTIDSHTLDLIMTDITSDESDGASLLDIIRRGLEGNGIKVYEGEEREGDGGESKGESKADPGAERPTRERMKKEIERMDIDDKLRLEAETAAEREAEEIYKADGGDKAAILAQELEDARADPVQYLRDISGDNKEEAFISPEQQARFDKLDKEADNARGGGKKRSKREEAARQRQAEAREKRASETPEEKDERRAKRREADRARADKNMVKPTKAARSQGSQGGAAGGSGGGNNTGSGSNPPADPDKE